MKNKNICLYGFRCTGKTTTGKHLAHLTGRRFMDTDELILKMSGKTVGDIVQNEGWDGFRNRETEAVNQVSGVTGAVLALGGGTVTIPHNVEKLKNKSVFIRLTVRPETIIRRMHIDNAECITRPALTETCVVEKEVLNLIKEREPVYASIADITIDAEGRTPIETAHKIKLELENYLI